MAHSDMINAEEKTIPQFIGMHILSGIGLGLGAAIVAIIFRMAGVRY